MEDFMAFKMAMATSSFSREFAGWNIQEKRQVR
jgi:hypothetical protein